MKKTILAVAAALFATTASAAILGSSHDFSSGTYSNLAGGSDCAYCHMPHNSPYSVTGAPLWARNIDYTQLYTPYSSAVSGHATPATTPNAGSRVCLSCHDGTQSMSVVFQVTGSGTQNLATSGNTATMAAGATRVGPNLGNDHPVSVTYSTAAAVFGLTGTPNAAFNIITVGTTTVECTSCHNAHNARGAATSYPNRQFMVTIAADFCGGCHSAK